MTYPSSSRIARAPVVRRRSGASRRARVAALACIQALAFAAAGVAADPPKSGSGKRIETWYASTVAKDGDGNALTVHFWSKGPLLRTEAVIAGRSIVTIVDAKTYYIFERVSGQGVAIERSERSIAQDATRGRPFGNELDDIQRDGGELIETRETPVGPVDVFRLTDAAGRRTVIASTKPPRVPLQVETYDRESGTRGQIDYVNWIYGPEIPDAFFQPHARIQLEKITYEQYKRRVGREAIGPAPVLYRELLHGPTTAE